MMEAAMIIRRMEEELRSDYQIELVEASTPQIHKALSNAVMYAISDNWRKARREHEHVRRAYYFSAESLMGRMVFNNLYCLGILAQIRDLLRARGCDLASMEDIEDAALGNGGLGRLAACFLDSAATHDLPLDGYGLRYKFGLFKQSFKNGYQCEKADDWQRYGDPWSRRRDDKTVEITFADQKVMAVPYDMPIVGYGTDNIGTLRLWQSEPLEEFDFNLFNEQEYDLAVREKNKVEDITRVLYPNDSTYEGKRLRLKQQYFLSSASLQEIIRRYKRVRGNDLSNFAAHCAIQLNDTHPTVSIPELVRLLMNEGMDFDAAFDITRKTFSYTNHTIMSEALEKWDYDLFMSVVPELADIISRINEVQNSELKARGVSQEQIDRMQIATGGQIHMARLAVFASTYVNGVAQIHSDILRHDLFKDWYSVTPDKFQNKTNGITQRRWLGLCNRELSEFITERIGGGFITDLSEISKLKQHMSDADIAAFNTLFKSVYLQLYIHCRKFIPDPEDAKDILQNVFLRFWEKRENIDIHTSLNAYLYRAIQNECLNYLRSTGTIEVPQCETTNVLFREEAEDNDPHSTLSVLEIEQIMENTIEELPDQCKSIFKLSRINGLKNQEIADKLDISVRTVETQIYRALKILKSRLKDYLAS